VSARVAALFLIALAAPGCSSDEPSDAPPAGDAGPSTRPGADGERCNPNAIGVETPAGASIDGCDLFTECVRGVCRPIASLLPCRDVGPVAELPELWTELAPSSSPPGRSRHSAVYDADNDRLIVFGGRRDATRYLNDTWVLAGATDLEGGATWTRLEPTGGPPPPRDNHAAGYDAASNRMIIFGGGDGSITRNDTWILSNANGLGGAPEWTELSAANAPYRGSTAAAYDAADNALVLFAGYSGLERPNEVWRLDNANGLAEPSSWSRLDVASAPPGRAYSPAAFDAEARVMLIFGGDSADSTPAQPRLLEDTWSLALTSSPAPTFRAVNAAGSPGERAHHSLVYDPMTQRAILFAGVTEGFARSDVHILRTGSGATWASFATGNAPPGRVGHGAGYSPQANRMVVFGGEAGDTRFDDTWVLERANGETPAAIERIEIRAAQTSLCTGRKMALTAVATTTDGELSVPVVWDCSEPAVVSSDGVVSARAAGDITCTACDPDEALCSEPFEIEITAPSSPPAADAGVGSCPNGFFYATQRTCTVLEEPGCTCDDFPCNACIPSADFPQAEGHALAEGETGCVDGDTGAIVKPCAPGLCCLVGGACGNPMGGSFCGECPARFACP
jgi:hypothetical protein